MELDYDAAVDSVMGGNEDKVAPKAESHATGNRQPSGTQALTGQQDIHSTNRRRGVVSGFEQFFKVRTPVRVGHDDQHRTGIDDVVFWRVEDPLAVLMGGHQQIFF